MKFALFLLALCVGSYATPTPEYFPAYHNGRERIVNGQNAVRGQFPYQVSMQWGIIGIWQHVCGGSIIGLRTILTAAHCITETPNIGGYRIISGILLLNENVANRQIIGVTQTIVHPMYAGGVNPHDVGILVLASNLALNADTAIINLAPAGTVPSGTAVLSGWGATNAAGNAMPNHLQFAQKTVLTLAECSAALISIMGNHGPLHETNVCTGGATGVSACSGDSGGPLQWGGNLLGVVSWGIMPCGTVGAPSVFVSVPHHIDWINANSVG